MGGILTDARGRSTVDGLWACGEVTSTGAHGANRLASNSLLEAVVFGARVAHDIATALPPPAKRVMAEARREARQAHDEEAVMTLRRAMSDNVGVIRDAESITTALRMILELEQQNAGGQRLSNMLTTAKLITTAAFTRKESRGGHFRSDYPAPDEKLAKRSFLTLAKADAILREAVGLSSPPRLRVVSQG
jgi:L-aspartate oxidase